MLGVVDDHPGALCRRGFCDRPEAFQPAAGSFLIARDAGHLEHLLEVSHRRFVPLEAHVQLAARKKGFGVAWVAFDRLGEICDRIFGTVQPVARAASAEEGDRVIVLVVLHDRLGEALFSRLGLAARSEKLANQKVHLGCLRVQGEYLPIIVDRFRAFVLGGIDLCTLHEDCAAIGILRKCIRVKLGGAFVVPAKRRQITKLDLASGHLDFLAIGFLLRLAVVVLFRDDSLFDLLLMPIVQIPPADDREPERNSGHPRDPHPPLVLRAAFDVRALGRIEIMPSRDEPDLGRARDASAQERPIFAFIAFPVVAIGVQRLAPDQEVAIERDECIERREVLGEAFVHQLDAGFGGCVDAGHQHTRTHQSLDQRIERGGCFVDTKQFAPPCAPLPDARIVALLNKSRHQGERARGFVAQAFERIVRERGSKRLDTDDRFVCGVREPALAASLP